MSKEFRNLFIKSLNILAPRITSSFEKYGQSVIRVRSLFATKNVSIGTFKRTFTVDQDIRFADSGDNTVIVEIPNFKLPAFSIITKVAAAVKAESDLATHNVNLQISATSGTPADTTVSSGTEILGAGRAQTDSSDSASAVDILMGTSAADLKKVWIVNGTIRGINSDMYLYVANAGTGNGTTNSKEGTLSIVVEYYGID
tara:strand:+ start:2437 stop:3036 length:600 start_codon:yes stop_codon:yes gene_type:complete